MNNNDDKKGKVGVTEHSDKELHSSDPTRMASKKRPRIDQDKTQIAPSSRKTIPQDDNTRVAFKKSVPASDKTQFKPKVRSAKPQNLSESNPNGSDTILDHGRKKRTPVSANLLGAGVPTQNDPQKTMLLKERFILEKVLGVGGMGIVYKAKDLVKVEAGDKDPYLAVKVLTDEFKQHPEAFVALQRESRKTQRIAHPNIMNVHDFDKDGDTVFMTMEYLDGKPLEQLIRQYSSTGLPTDEALDIIKYISHALIYAHDQDIIHSDFKPGNIFVTNNGNIKVFDFGIARAVAKAEHYDDNPEDKTVFDAGDLGALTPTYASAEMLNGLEPDVRDDIYALGCVAYELFTGAHPFNRVPADEAQRQKLKPKRINNISRQQWKAIEKALAFKREDRVESVKEFLRLMTETDSKFKIISAILISLAIFTVIYFQFIRGNSQPVDTTEIRSELEYRLRLENYREKVDSSVANAEFSTDWEAELWIQVQSVDKLLQTSETWLGSTSNAEFKTFLEDSITWYSKKKHDIITLYRKQILSVINLQKYIEARELIANAYRYTDDSHALSEEENKLEQAIVEYDAHAKDRQLAAEQEKRIKADNAAKASRNAKAKLRDVQFNKSLSNVQEQLQCVSSKLNMRNIDTAIQKLRSVNKAKYLKIEGGIIVSLANCIKRIAKQFPERAIELKKYALRIFKRNTTLSSIVILARDPCDPLLAGLGARGNRTTCKDAIDKLGNGPSLVVIPRKSGIPTFAIGRYEVSIAEYNLFCKASRHCTEIKNKSDNLPITNISLKDVQKYLKWLSSKTKKKYRLPSKKEWLYAAKAKRVSLDPNRNCKLKTRGISKGDKLVRASIGSKNGWGLVNYVGNASEWVLDKGRILMAVGGSYNIPMEKCDISNSVKHSGKADKLVGFRVYRELRK